MNYHALFDVFLTLLYIIQNQATRAATMETYTPEQAAKILHLNVQTVRKWLRNGDLTGADTPAGWRLTPADLETWLNRHRKPRQAKQEQSDDEDAHWAKVADAALDRLAEGKTTVMSFEEWERRCDALDG
jgi:excisionase family DNA binding protein